MSERDYRRQFLICMAVGCTCLALWLVVYQLEGAWAARGLIAERSTNVLILLFMAISMLFSASLMHSRMLLAERSNDAPPPDTQPLWVGRLVTVTVLLTLVVGVVVESSTVGLEAFWQRPASGEWPPTLFGLPVEVGVAPVGMISGGPLAVGVISVGGVGVISLGGIGIVSFGGIALGGIAVGGASCGLISIGGAALGYVAVGGGALGVYVMAGAGKGRYVLSRQRQDPPAVEFFCKYIPFLRRCQSSTFRR